LAISIEKLQEWFTYDPLTGWIQWKKKPNRNTRPGDKAGWTVTDLKNGMHYIVIQCEKNKMLAHVAAFALQTGKLPTGEIDHINGNGVDNRWENLRDVSHAINGRNQKMSKANTSGAMGVDFHAASQSWRARIIVNRKEKHLGMFKTKEDAIAARKAAEMEHGFHANHGRLS